MEEEQSKKSTSFTCNLDSIRAEKSVWMMKCPVAVGKSWQSHSDSRHVAKVVLSIDPLSLNDLSTRRFIMEMADTEENLPKSYALNMSKDIVPMSVFSENSQGRLAIEGKVEHKFDMKPNSKTIEEYGKLCRERTNKSMIKNRQLQVLDNDRGIHMRPMPGMIGLSAFAPKDKKRIIPVKPSEMKRTRRNRAEVEDFLFKLFERQTNWGLKQLIQETEQPAQYVKEILNDICTYNKRGANQGKYELKPEYKKSAEETGAE